MKINKILLEDNSQEKVKVSVELPDDNEKEQTKRRRIIKALRVAAEARNAAKIARKNGQDAEADDLEEEAQQLEDWANEQYTLPDNGPQGGSGKEDDSEEEQESAAEEAEEAAQRAKEAAEEAEQAAQKAQKAADDLAKQGEDNSNAQEAADVAKEAAEEAKEAAEEAAEHAKAAKEAEEAGDSETAEQEAEAANEAADRAEEAAEEAINTVNEADEESENSSESNSGDEEDDAIAQNNSSQNSSQNSSDSNADNSENNSNSNSSTEDSEDSDDESQDKSNNSSSGNSNSEDESESDDDSEDDEDDESQGEGSSEQVQNPFDIDPKNAQTQQGEGGGNMPKPSKADEFEAMKKILKMLRGGEAAGAKAALNDILKARSEKNESLQEKLSITKDIEDISEDTFNDLINSTLDKINKVNPVKWSEDRDVRVKEISDHMSSTKTRRDLAAEDEATRTGGRDQIRQKRAREREIDKYRVSSLPGTAEFKLDLYDAIRDQVDRVLKQQDSWSAINKRHQNSDIIKKGQVIHGEFEDKKPNIQVYLDCSGSFSESDIKKERALLKVLAEFVDQGEIEAPQIYYFSNNLFDNFEQAKRQGGTSAWNEIMQEIKDTNPANVLIVTDSDMNYQAAKGATYRVDGCVWYIWNDTRSGNMPDHLFGEINTKEYRMDW